MRQKIFELLTQVFEDVFDEDVTLTDQTTADDVDGWDSLNHVRLMMAVERAFKVSFSASEIGELANIGGLVDLIEKKSPRLA